jgi:hypothetical protein
VSEYTLPVNIRKIVALAGPDGPLTNIGPKEYLNFREPGAAGIPEYYIYYKRNALTGARVILIGGIPDTITNLEAVGKKRFPKFLETDLGTAKSLLPFPDDGGDVLSAFVEADIYRLQSKKDLIFPQDALAESKLKAWRGEESTEPAQNAKSNLPAYLRIKMQNRRNGYVV